ncbi:MAG: DUF3592 domain-containing protein [Chloroflexi bacterium]|nr:DUF3592 domain-containing protein [Chloroflexota bacterium]
MEQNLAAILSLLIILSSVLVIILLPKRAAYVNKLPKLHKTGDPADADVLSVKHISEADNGTVLVSVQLRVYPSDDTPYETRTNARIWRVDIPHVQPGRKVPVWIDPKNPENVAVDLEIA